VVNHKIEWRSRTCAYVYTLINIDTMLGKLLQGRYQVVQILSAGGFCQTYLAQDTQVHDYPTCVVKHLKPASNHPDSLQTLRWLFTGEAQALAKLGNHNRIPQLLAHFEENLEFYLVQEFIPGHLLSAELQPGHCWNESQVIQLLQEVLGILEFVHSHGLIHRDIKPSNLIRRQQDGRLVLIDFGSVKQAWTQVVRMQGLTISTFAIGLPSSITIGTPGYMPTEQGRGRPRPNSDIYALGMIGIQALTGLNPRQLLEDSDTSELLWQHQAQVSTELASVLSKMVCYHFKDRYQSATEVLQALQPLADLYPPTQHSVSEHSSTQLETPQTSLTATPVSQAKLRIDVQTRGQGVLEAPPISLSPHPPSSPKKSALLIDMGIGFVAALVLMAGIYYAMRSPAPASKIQKYPVSIPLKSSSFDNN
jgi:serine/threonine-protein kinase